MKCKEHFGMVTTITSVDDRKKLAHRVVAHGYDLVASVYRSSEGLEVTARVCVNVPKCFRV